MKTKKDSEWAELLQETLKSRENSPSGPGWKTAGETQTMLGLGSTATKSFLRKVIAEGRAEMFRGTQLSNGNLVNQTWYRIKKPAK